MYYVLATSKTKKKNPRPTELIELHTTFCFLIQHCGVEYPRNRCTRMALINHLSASIRNGKYAFTGKSIFCIVAITPTYSQSACGLYCNTVFEMHKCTAITTLHGHNMQYPLVSTYLRNEE